MSRDSKLHFEGIRTKFSLELEQRIELSHMWNINNL
jgi:hypothetical protein